MLDRTKYDSPTNATKTDLFEQRQALVAEYRKVCDVTPENWTPEIEARANDIDAKIQAIDAKITEHRKTEQERAARVAQAAETRQRGATGNVFMTSEGREVRSLRHDEPFASDGDEFRFGHCLKALLTNDHGGLSDHERRGLFGATDANGGYLLDSKLSAQVVDLARSASVCIRAGAQTLPMDSAELTITRLASDVSSYWRSEGVSVTASRPTFDRIILRPRTLAAIVPVSLELMEDAANLPSILSNALSAALGLKLDQAALLGSGAGAEPIGIRNTTGVNSVGSVGTPTDFSDITGAVGNILTANYNGDPSSLAWVLHPRDGETFANLQDTTHQPLQPTPWVAALRKFYTTSLPTNEGAGAASVSIVGDFSQMLIGTRTRGVTIRVLDSGTATDGTTTYNGASDLMKFVVCHLRADIAILRPSWFTVLTGITNS